MSITCKPGDVLHINCFSVDGIHTPGDVDFDVGHGVERLVLVVHVLEVAVDVAPQVGEVVGSWHVRHHALTKLSLSFGPEPHVPVPVLRGGAVPVTGPCGTEWPRAARKGQLDYMNTHPSWITHPGHIPRQLTVEKYPSKMWFLLGSSSSLWEMLYSKKS